MEKKRVLYISQEIAPFYRIQTLQQLRENYRREFKREEKKSELLCRVTDVSTKEDINCTKSFDYQG